jgi:hypothetical protein
MNMSTPVLGPKSAAEFNPELAALVVARGKTGATPDSVMPGIQHMASP